MMVVMVRVIWSCGTSDVRVYVRASDVLVEAINGGLWRLFWEGDEG